MRIRSGATQGLTQLPEETRRQRQRYSGTWGQQARGKTKHARARRAGQQATRGEQQARAWGPLGERVQGTTCRKRQARDGEGCGMQQAIRGRQGMGAQQANRRRWGMREGAGRSRQRGAGGRRGRVQSAAGEAGQARDVGECRVQQAERGRQGMRAVAVRSRQSGAGGG